MIQGNVVGLQAQIGVLFCIPDREQILEIKCVVDTGFEGFLTLPSAAVVQLQLPYLINLNANLADNSSVQVDVHLATILWHGVEKNIAVMAMGRRPLIGTSLLQDYHLAINFFNGGKVIIDEIL